MRPRPPDAEKERKVGNNGYDRAISVSERKSEEKGRTYNHERGGERRDG